MIITVNIGPLPRDVKKRYTLFTPIYAKTAANIVFSEVKVKSNTLPLKSLSIYRIAIAT